MELSSFIFLLYFRKELYSEKKTPRNPKILYTLNKTPLGETGCLSNLYYLLVAQPSNFLIG